MTGPLNAAGIALILAGIGFMVAEAFVPSFGILGIAGVAAFIFGATFMFDVEGMPGLALDAGIVWGSGLFGLLLVALVVLVTAKAYRRQVSVGPESMIGQSAKIVEWEGRKGRVLIQGEIWQAESDSPLELQKDDHVRVDHLEDLTLKIRADS